MFTRLYRGLTHTHTHTNTEIQRHTHTHTEKEGGREGRREGRKEGGREERREEWMDGWISTYYISVSKLVSGNGQRRLERLVNGLILLKGQEVIVLLT